MNRMHNRAMRRYAIAFVMLIVAGYLSVVIKDTIDSRNPEVSLPAVTVSAGYAAIPNVPRAGYEWSFRTKDIMAPYVSSIDVPLVAYDSLPDTPIVIDFSIPYKQISLYESEGVLINGRVVANGEFKEKKYSNNTPNEDGIYVYKMVARFEQGTIVHFFALDVAASRASI